MVNPSRRLATLAAVLLGVSVSSHARPATQSAANQPSVPLWIAPAKETGRPTALATAITQLEDGKASAALPALQAAAKDPVVGAYARVYVGRAQLALDRPADAMASGESAKAAAATPYLKERALWLVADAAEASASWQAAADALTALVDLPTVTPVQARYRLAVASEQLGRTDAAIEHYQRVYYEFPLSDEASQAGAALAKLTPASRASSPERLSADLKRAQSLFEARRYADARKAFDALRPLASGNDADLIALRVAQLDFHQRRLPAASAALRTYLDRDPGNADRRVEAEFFLLGVLREQGRETEYVGAVNDFVQRHPTSTWAEAAMNELGTHYILTDADDKAAAIFTEQYGRFPAGVHGARAAWKAGWWAFTSGNYAETVRLFESAAEQHRRSDYRSGWVYWAARAHERLGQRDRALEGYARTIGDYGNSYYGREADRARETLLAAMRPAGAGPVAPVRREGPLTFNPGAEPANVNTIRALLSAHLWDDAIGEVRRAQRDEGPRPLLDATLAYAYNRKGELRLAISAMKRAYPQYLADGSESLPRDVLTVIFPLEYWDLIQKHAQQHDLDPYVVAALMAQESTFDEKIRSAANAWGLMQILPSTGARYARRLGIRPFNTASLTKPEINVRIGTQYFADLVKRYNGDLAPALAAYNAGENRVDRWLEEHPGLERDEFVDNIPFPETQGYVKKILGTAEDYRVLYRRSAPVRR